MGEFVLSSGFLSLTNPIRFVQEMARNLVGRGTDDFVIPWEGPDSQVKLTYCLHMSSRPMHRHVHQWFPVSLCMPRYRTQVLLLSIT